MVQLRIVIGQVMYVMVSTVAMNFHFEMQLFEDVLEVVYNKQNRVLTKVKYK